MKLLLLLLCTVAVCVVADTSIDNQYASFLVEYNKKYTQEESLKRFEIFKQNLKTIEEHNSNKDATFKLGVNQFADMTNEEFRATKLSINKRTIHAKVGNLELDTTVAPPASLDWRTNKDFVVVGPVKDSGQCGSPSVIPIVDAISSEYSVRTQQDFYAFDYTYVTSCDGQGCNGGNDNVIWSFIFKYGLNWYFASCPTGPGLGLCITGKNCTTPGNEAVLQAAVASLGPLSIAVDASQTSFQLYKSGVYTDKACSSTNVDHGLLLVGYGTTTDGQDYWIARNDWGTAWGQSGDILLARNKNNQCGVATEACGGGNVHTCVC
jgi:cathepsin L